MPVNQVGVYLMIYFTHGRVGGGLVGVNAASAPK